LPKAIDTFDEMMIQRWIFICCTYQIITNRSNSNSFMLFQ